MGEFDTDNREEFHYQLIDSLDVKTLPSQTITMPHVEPDGDVAFIRNHTKGWKHGVPIPYTVFKYFRAKTSNDLKISTVIYKQDLLRPSAVFEEINNGSIQIGTSSDTSSTSHFGAQVSEEEARRREEIIAKHTNSYSGYYLVPVVTVNFPTSIRESMAGKTNLGHLCYQNHYDIDDWTYTFGGVVTSEEVSLKLLGLPNDTDPDKISVQFNCELPPHVSRDVLTSPYLVQNNILFLFNPLRGSSSFLEPSFDMGESASHFNCMGSTRISYRHIFFYGGFTIQVDLTHFDAPSQRWIVKKRLVLNEDGYIFDIFTFRFKKITLKTRDGALDVILGRLGHATTSSLWSKKDDSSVPERAPLPPQFTDFKNGTFVPPSPERKPKREEPAPSTASTQASAPKITKVARSSTNESEVSASTAQTASSTSIGRITPSLASLKTATNSSSSSSTSPSAASKVTSVLTKSSRIFHRGHRQNTSPKAKEPSAHQAHLLKNTYSKQVKQRRTHSSSQPHGSTLNPHPLSRSSSPVRPSKPKPEPVHKKDIFNNETLSFETSLDPKPYYSNQQYTGFPASPNQAAPRNYLPTQATTTPSNQSDTDQSSTVDSIDSQLKSSSLESMNKTGIVTIPVFVFGGYTCHLDPENNQFKVFKALADLLRIELILQEGTKANMFLDDAFVYLVGTHDSDSLSEKDELWPSPRGYFGHAVVNHNPGLDGANGDFGLGPSFESPRSYDINASLRSHANFFDGKLWVIHGGVDDDLNHFSDFYVFNFDTGHWLTFETLVFDYFNAPLQPYEDQDPLAFDFDKADPNPKLIPAELRSCHHTMLYYQNEENEYLFFVAGFNNDYLRHFDKKPYTSNKFDVLRLAKFQIVTTNSQLSRVMVLNLRTKTWKFLKYISDIKYSMIDSDVDKINSIDVLKDARISHYGGIVSLNGKTITACHGLAKVIPVKKEDFEKVDHYLPNSALLWGCHVHFIFPTL